MRSNNDTDSDVNFPSETLSQMKSSMNLINEDLFQLNKNSIFKSNEEPLDVLMRKSLSISQNEKSQFNPPSTGLYDLEKGKKEIKEDDNENGNFKLEEEKRKNAKPKMIEITELGEIPKIYFHKIEEKEYIFYKEKATNNTVYYQCYDRKNCSGRLSIELSKIENRFILTNPKVKKECTIAHEAHHWVKREQIIEKIESKVNLKLDNKDTQLVWLEKIVQSNPLAGALEIMDIFRKSNIGETILVGIHEINLIRKNIKRKILDKKTVIERIEEIKGNDGEILCKSKVSTYRKRTF